MATHPDILLIIADQLAASALPAYGNTRIDTPHIDRIASRAARFTRCYSPCPLCQPVRAAFWTGHFPHETGVLSNGWRTGERAAERIPDDMPTVGTVLSGAGYEAVHFGKTHDSGSLRGFEVEPVRQEHVEAEPGYPLNGDTWQDRYTAARAAEYLRREHERPFLCAVDLNNPHNICGWIGEHADPPEHHPADADLPPLPDNFEVADWRVRPRPVQYQCCAHRRLSQTQRWGERDFQRYVAAYEHYVQRLDDEVGRVLDALEDSGGAENTIVIFTADHGDAMTAHRAVTKHTTFYEETTRVPFMIAMPGSTSGEGRDVQQPLASLLDLLPTLCDAAGTEPPAGLWGESLLPWARGEREDYSREYLASEWHTEWGYTIEPGRMIRSDRYKYTRYLEGDGEELFDLWEDPGEMRTLIDDAANRDVVERHRAMLRQHVETTGDPFFSMEWRADERWRRHEPGYEHHVGESAPEEAAT